VRPGVPHVPLGLRLAVSFLPREVREEVLGDLLERWASIESTRSWLGRSLWVWRQPVATLLVRTRLLARLRAREPARVPIAALPASDGASTTMMRMAGFLSMEGQDRCRP